MGCLFLLHFTRINLTQRNLLLIELVVKRSLLKRFGNRFILNRIALQSRLGQLLLHIIVAFLLCVGFCVLIGGSGQLLTGILIVVVILVVAITVIIELQLWLVHLVQLTQLVFLS